MVASLPSDITGMIAAQNQKRMTIANAAVARSDRAAGGPASSTSAAGGEALSPVGAGLAAGLARASLTDSPAPIFESEPALSAHRQA